MDPQGEKEISRKIPGSPNCPMSRSEFQDVILIECKTKNGYKKPAVPTKHSDARRPVISLINFLADRANAQCVYC